MPRTPPFLITKFSGEIAVTFSLLCSLIELVSNSFFNNYNSSRYTSAFVFDIADLFERFCTIFNDLQQRHKISSKLFIQLVNPSRGIQFILQYFLHSSLIFTSNLFKHTTAKLYGYFINMNMCTNIHTYICILYGIQISLIRIAQLLHIQHD